MSLFLSCSTVSCALVASARCRISPLWNLTIAATIVRNGVFKSYRAFQTSIEYHHLAQLHIAGVGVGLICAAPTRCPASSDAPAAAVAIPSDAPAASAAAPSDAPAAAVAIPVGVPVAGAMPVDAPEPPVDTIPSGAPAAVAMPVGVPVAGAMPVDAPEPPADTIPSGAPAAVAMPVDAPGAIPEQPVAVPVDAPVAAAAPKVKAGFGRGRKRANTPVKKGTITGLKTSLAKRVEWGRKIREVRKPERKRIIAEASAATGKSVNAIRMWLLKLNIYGFAKSAQGSK